MPNRLTPEQKESAAGMAVNIICALSKEEILELICEEWVYWHDTDFETRPNLNDASMIAVGALSNIIGRIAMGGRDYGKQSDNLIPQFDVLKRFIEETGQEKGSISGKMALAALDLIEKGS